MGKNVIDNKVINPNNKNEMVDLFMYEKLKDIKKYVNESELIIFFDRMFNEASPKRGYDRIIQQLERKLDLITYEFKSNLRGKGYKLNEPDEPEEINGISKSR